MKIKRRDSSGQIQDHLSELMRQRDVAERQARQVSSREESINRFRDEMKEIRQRNHFTQLFLETIQH